MHYAAGITIFTVFFSMMLVTGDTQQMIEGDRMEKHNVTESDLKISPDLPNPQRIELDLEDDIEDSHNIRVDATEDLNNTEYDTEKVVSLDNASEEGWVIYRVPDDAVDFKTKATKWGFLTPSEIELEAYLTPDINNTPEASFWLKGTQDFVREEDGNYIAFRFDAAEDARLYELELKDDVEKGALQTFTSWIGSAANAATSWLTIITGLPSVLSWISIVFGILGLLIILALILW